MVLPTSFASAFSPFCPLVFSEERRCCRTATAEEGNFFDNLALKQRPNSSSLLLYTILSFLYTIISFKKTDRIPHPLPLDPDSAGSFTFH